MVTALWLAFLLIGMCPYRANTASVEYRRDGFIEVTTPDCIEQSTCDVCSEDGEECKCVGMVHYGTGLTWTQGLNVDGKVDCQAASFGGDPAIGQSKQCRCTPHECIEPYGICYQKGTSNDVDSDSTVCALGTECVGGEWEKRCNPTQDTLATLWRQCGGIGCTSTGGCVSTCAAGQYCRRESREYSQCLPIPLENNCGRGEAPVQPRYYAQCGASGDPHYRTFDGAHYSFQGQCEYRLVGTACHVSGAYGDSKSFEVQVRNSKRPYSVTVTEAAAVNLPDIGVVELLRDRTLLNGVAMDDTVVRLCPAGTTDSGVDNDSPSPGCAIITHHNSGRWRVNIKYEAQGRTFGAEVQWSRGSRIRVTLSHELEDGVCGLCGDFDDDRANDKSFASQHGYWLAGSTNLPSLFTTVLERPGAESECIAGSTSTTAPGHTTTQAPCVALDAIEQSRADSMCNIISDVEGPYAACHEKVDPADFVADCLFDVCALGADIGCDTIMAYEQACAPFKVPFVSVIDACGVCLGDGSSCPTEETTTVSSSTDGWFGVGGGADPGDCVTAACGEWSEDGVWSGTNKKITRLKLKYLGENFNDLKGLSHLLPTRDGVQLQPNKLLTITSPGPTGQAVKISFDGNLKRNNAILGGAAAGGGFVQPGQIFDVSMPNNGRFPGNSIFVLTDPANQVYEVAFHTSCSNPLSVGDAYGSLLIVGWTHTDAETSGNCDTSTTSAATTKSTTKSTTSNGFFGTSSGGDPPSTESSSTTSEIFFVGPPNPGDPSLTITAEGDFFSYMELSDGPTILAEELASAIQEAEPTIQIKTVEVTLSQNELVAQVSFTNADEAEAVMNAVATGRVAEASSIEWENGESSSKSSASNNGAMAGALVGAILAVGLLAGFVIRRRSGSTKLDSADSKLPSNPPPPSSAKSDDFFDQGHPELAIHDGALRFISTHRSNPLATAQYETPVGLATGPLYETSDDPQISTPMYADVTDHNAAQGISSYEDTIGHTAVYTAATPVTLPSDASDAPLYDDAVGSAHIAPTPTYDTAEGGSTSCAITSPSYDAATTPMYDAAANSTADNDTPMYDSAKIVGSSDEGTPPVYDEAEPSTAPTYDIAVDGNSEGTAPSVAPSDPVAESQEGYLRV